MKYSFQLLPHPNVHYQEALGKLGLAELRCLMRAAGIDAEVIPEKLGGSAFLSFEAPVLTEKAIACLSRHSALLLLCRREGDLLAPLDRPDSAYFPRDLAEVLKYKGKTSPTFTTMMLNCALSASRFFAGETPVTVLDPLCGRGTTAFCALQMGMNAVGLDLDRRDLKEAGDYFTRYLQYHRLKYQTGRSSRTVGGVSVPEEAYTVADTREHYQSGDTRTLRFLAGDASLAGPLLQKHPAELIVADLPYGIQHAPQDGRKPEPFEGMLRRVLPSWLGALRPGGAMALSFNTLTLPKSSVLRSVREAGFTPLTDSPYDDFSHFVEQAVHRDLVISVKS